MEKNVTLPNPAAFGEGSTIMGDDVFYLTWQHHEGYVLDRTTLAQKRRFTYHGEGWGLTNDGTSLIMSSGSDVITFRDPHTFEIQRSISVTLEGQPIYQLNELEYVNGTIFANVYMDSRIVAIDAHTGQVTGVLDAQPLWDEASAKAQEAGQPLRHEEVVNGIAYLKSKGTLLLTGKRWPISFEVAITSRPHSMVASRE